MTTAPMVVHLTLEVTFAIVVGIKDSLIVR
jgi:hypothetical protein